MTPRSLAVTIAVIACALGARLSQAQEIDRTLPAQLSAPTRATLERLIDSARVAGLPVDPLYSKVREGVIRSADESRVIAAVQRLGRDLGEARSALGDSASAEEITAGANALRAGIRGAELSRLRDSRGRKQYRYHPRWRSVRDRAKFDRILAFADALPRLRRRITRDLARPGLPQEKVVATIVRLLDTTRARVGNHEYARDNRTYGLTTLRDDHVRFTRAGLAVLDFNGKGRTRHRIEVSDPRIAAIVRECHALDGRHLFQSEDAVGRCRPVRARHVNEYLRAHLGGEFTAKDFRTWGATLRAVRLLERTAVPEPRTQKNVRTTINEVVRQVSEELRNTPAVCRRSYICPSVFDDWLEGNLPARWSGRRR